MAIGTFNHPDDMAAITINPINALLIIGGKHIAILFPLATPRHITMIKIQKITPKRKDELSCQPFPYHFCKSIIFPIIPYKLKIMQKIKIKRSIVSGFIYLFFFVPIFYT